MSLTDLIIKRCHPTNQRRLRVFFANRRTVCSLWLFSLLFFICIFAELIANDKPIIVSYKNSWYFPALTSYPETTFGGDFDTEADYRDPYIVQLINAAGWIQWPLIHYSYDTHIADLPQPAPSPPDANNWLGTDDQARDVLARVIYGFRTSILFALALTIGSSILGIAAGAIQGYYGGKIDLFGQRFLEIWGGLPQLYVLIILASIIKPNFWWLLAIMLLFSWTQLVGIVRAGFLRGRNLDYVRAARALGVGDATIMWRHILPNALVAAFTMIPFILTGAITSLTALDFLGFGLPPGSASLGELVSQAKGNLHAPWLIVTAFTILSITLMLLVFIGEGIRDAFDPKATVG
jgi:microcin C transport system permease protein